MRFSHCVVAFLIWFGLVNQVIQKFTAIQKTQVEICCVNAPLCDWSCQLRHYFEIEVLHFELRLLKIRLFFFKWCVLVNIYLSRWQKRHWNEKHACFQSHCQYFAHDEKDKKAFPIFQLYISKPETHLYCSHFNCYFPQKKPIN